MTQLNRFTTKTAPIIHNDKEEIFKYNDSKVKIITVFNDNRGSTALVENENGEIFQVPKNSLR